MNGSTGKRNEENEERNEERNEENDADVDDGDIGIAELTRNSHNMYR